MRVTDLAPPPEVDTSAPVVVLMGVSGSGKTTVGALLADALGWLFFEGDEFHPPSNVDRMSSGLPLEDEHRGPWLDALEELIRGLRARGVPAVLACSALKASYRAQLSVDAGVRFVFLYASEAVLRARLEARSGHFMPAELLKSQLDTLEAPGPGVLQVSVHRPAADVAEEIRAALEPR